jgi:hypothetical protein
MERLTEHYPLFLKNEQNVVYAMDGNCAKLYTPTFQGVLTFLVRNKFQNYKDMPIGILKIKSLKTYSAPVGTRIKVSRRAGWYADGNGEVLRELNDRQLKMTPSEWTAMHTGDGTPQGVNDRLKLKWHGYADADGQITSTDEYGFWNFPTENSDRQTLTNYLVRFASAADGNDIEFYAEVPADIQSMDLSLDSNFEVARGRYRFIFER